MKKIILSVMVSAISAFTFAQQGTFEIGGSIGFQSNSIKEINGDVETKTSDLTSFSILPNFMYYVTDKLAVGAGIGFSYQKDDAKNNKLSIFNIVPTLRYKQPIAGAFSYAPELYIGLGFGSNKHEINDESEVSKDVTAISAGISVIRFEYAIAPKFNLAFSCGNIGYDYYKVEDTGKMNNFGISLNFAPTLGFSYVF